ncbi:mechanosensitive ion channel family protein [Halorarius litoreus]|uniref:mechanosensitive ion channel family protein n=1 Tax=Halorarius litoreus TaxID=2962676 RepID=UPI0020CC09AF|nr:mechanosensitive ion channel family protein [Halorarius litoreus]
MPQAGTPTPTPTPPGSTGGAGTGLQPPPWLPELVPTAFYRLFAAAIVIVVAYYVSSLARQILGRRIARRFRRPSVTRTILRGIQGAIIIFAGFIALTFFGFQASDLVISLSVFSAVLGFILAPIIGSVINGLFVLSERPYEVGDMIHLSDKDTYGFVEDVTLRYTKIFTLDNTFLIVPNGSMRERDVVNFSAEDSRTRLKLDVLVTYESDIAEARELIEQAARDVDNVIGGGPDIRIGGARYPAAPTCYIDTFADHGVNLRLRYWAIEPYKLLTVRSKVQTKLWELLEDADVEIAYPHQHLFFDETSGEMQVAMRETDGPPEHLRREPPDASVDADESAPDSDATTD